MGSLHANAKHTHHIFSQLQGYVFKKKEKPEQPQRLRGQPLQNKHALKKDTTGVTSQSRTITTSCALTPPYLEAALLPRPHPFFFLRESSENRNYSQKAPLWVDRNADKMAGSQWSYYGGSQLPRIIPRKERRGKKLEQNIVTSSSDDENGDCILPYFRLYN